MSPRVTDVRRFGDFRLEISFPDLCENFGERDCLKGGLGQFSAKYLVAFALAHVGRLDKFGA